MCFIELLCTISVKQIKCVYIRSTWEGREAQKGVIGKESIKDRPPANLGRGDYVGKRFGQGDREMARMIGEDRWIRRDK